MSEIEDAYNDGYKRGVEDSPDPSPTYVPWSTFAGEQIRDAYNDGYSQGLKSPAYVGPLRSSYTSTGVDEYMQEVLETEWQTQQPTYYSPPPSSPTAVFLAYASIIGCLVIGVLCALSMFIALFILSR